jgi:V/A-type H+-transporting ATPase subunit D
VSRQLAPTRSNLVKAQRTLRLAREARDVLDQKRETLTNELIRIARDATQLETEVQDLLAEAYRTLNAARMVTGREHLEWAALSVNKTMEVEITPRSIMGVRVPSVAGTGGPPEVSYGMGNTTVALDEAAASFRTVLQEIPQLAETLSTAWRLAQELKIIQRRVHALEHVFIPEYRETVSHIRSVLEEREREEFFRLKRIKSRHGPRHGTERDQQNKELT